MYSLCTVVLKKNCWSNSLQRCSFHFGKVVVTYSMPHQQVLKHNEKISSCTTYIEYMHASTILELSCANISDSLVLQLHACTRTSVREHESFMAVARRNNQ